MTEGEKKGEEERIIITLSFVPLICFRSRFDKSVAAVDDG